VKKGREQSKHQSQSKIQCFENGCDSQSKVVPFSNEVVEVLTEKDHKLLTLTQLGKELNVSPDFVKDMRTMGFPLPIGGKTTLTYAMNWLNHNPNFREDARILKLSRSPKRF